MRSERRHPRWLGVLLWATALLLMLAAGVYQRLTGPTYPVRGELVVEGQSHSYRLIRSQETSERAKIALPRPGPEATGTLSYRRYPTNDPFETVELEVAPWQKGPALIGHLPIQPPAGKMEYYLELETAAGPVRIPEAGAEESTIVLRYKGPVPTTVLIAHVAFMFLSMLIGMRAGLGALFAPSNIRSLSRITLFGLTVGGLVLGPFVQKHAFGEYWTGFPWGYDLTDNKTLIMWVVWVVAVAALAGAAKRIGVLGRVAVLAATLVMTAVYLIPHSLRGSELDFEAVDAGVAASEAVGTSEEGRR
jgi:hypothetical protein